MPVDTSLEKKNSNLDRFAWFILGFYAILAYVDVIEVMVPYVLVLDGVVAVCSLAFIGYSIYRIKPGVRLDVVTVSFYVFSLFTILSMIVKKGDLDRNVVALFQIVQMSSIVLSLYVLREQWKNIMKYLSVFVVAFSFFVLSCSYRIFISDSGLRGITINANPFGMLLTTGVMFALYLISTINSRKIKALLFVLAVYFIAGLFRTNSDTAIICLFVGVFSFYILKGLGKMNRRKRKILILTLVIVFALMLVVLSVFLGIRFNKTGVAILSGRESIWTDSLRVSSESLLLGYGGNTSEMLESYAKDCREYSYVYAGNHFLHNIYIQILVEYGAIVLAAFLVLVFAVVFYFIKDYIKTDEYKDDIMSMSITFVLMYLLEGITESNLLYFGGTEQFTFIFVLGILYCNHICSLKYTENTNTK